MQLFWVVEILTTLEKMMMDGEKELAADGFSLCILVLGYLVLANKDGLCARGACDEQ